MFRPIMCVRWEQELIFIPAGHSQCIPLNGYIEKQGSESIMGPKRTDVHCSGGNSDITVVMTSISTIAHVIRVSPWAVLPECEKYLRMPQWRMKRCWRCENIYSGFDAMHLVKSV